MHIILGLLVALGGALWAFKHIVDGASEAKSAARRFQWQNRSAKDRLDALNDPREAAAILFVQMRRYEGELTQLDRDMVAKVLMDHMGTSPADAEEIVSYAAFATSEGADAGNRLAKVLAPIQASCTEDEKREFVDMLTGLASGTPSEIQQTLIGRVKDRLTR